MTLKDKTIGFAITGSFCTIQTVYTQLQGLVDEGADVIPILSGAVDTFDTRFGTAAQIRETIQDITKNSVFTTICDSEPIGPKGILDLLIVAPCTGNTLAKLANAITDSSVTMAVKAQLRNNKPCVLAVSTNDGLGGNAKNIGMLLNMKNIYFVPFYQDDPNDKSNSLAAKYDWLMETARLSLDGKQIQPVLQMA